MLYYIDFCGWVLYNHAIMFICKTATQKYSHNGNTYHTYRLVRTYRNSEGKVKRETILNLGNHFSIPQPQWRILIDRVEQLLSGTRQLFELDIPLKLEKEAKRIVKIITTRNSESVQATTSVAPSSMVNSTTPTDYQAVDINSTQEDEVRHIGNEHVVYAAANQLNLPGILLDVGLNQKQSNIALASIISRLIVPGSELKAHKYITTKSAMDEIIGTELSGLDLQYMYFASDWLLAHKDKIEDLLYHRECELFNLTKVITLFDITNTYFEGHPKAHPLVSKGRSKEKRSDCELISLGLLLDGSGFPKKSKILPGNISEPSTLKGMLSYLEAKDDAVIIMDAGIATKDNLEYLSTHGYKYIVVKRDTDLVMPENDHVIVKDTTNNKVTVSLVNNKDTLDLYCHSTAKEAKVIEFTNKMSTRFEEELSKLNQNLPACNLYVNFEEFTLQSTAIILSDGRVFSNNSQELITLLIKLETPTGIPDNFFLDNELTSIVSNNNELLKLVSKWNGQVKLYSKIVNKLRKAFKSRVHPTKTNVTREYDKVAIKIGRLKQQYKSVAHMYEIDILSDTKKHYSTKIIYTKNSEKVANKQSGIYCLSSNLTDVTADTLWNTYTMLTEIESAFRSLKSELGMRPVYHQLEHRIDGHIFISILAYHLLHTIRYQLKLQGINNSWDSLRSILALQIRSTTTLDLQTGGTVKIRKTSKPTPEQVAIYKALGIAMQPCSMVKSYFRSHIVDSKNLTGAEVVVP